MKRFLIALGVLGVLAIGCGKENQPVGPAPNTTSGLYVNGPVAPGTITIGVSVGN